MVNNNSLVTHVLDILFVPMICGRQFTGRLLILLISILVFGVASVGASNLLSPSDRTGLIRAVNQIEKKDFEEAVQTARSINSPVARDFIVWYAARHGSTELSHGFLDDASRKLKAWPLQSVLAKNTETRFLETNPSDDQVFQFLSHRQLVSDQAKLALAKVYQSRANTTEAVRLIRDIWKDATIDDDVANDIVTNFGSSLDRGLLLERFEQLFFAGQYGQLDRLAPFLGTDFVLLSSAANRVMRNLDNASEALARVPASVQGGIFRYINIRYLRRKDRLEEAADMLRFTGALENSVHGNSDWTNMRMALARELQEQKKYHLAYGVVANHNAVRESDIIDAEFLAGWIALRNLNSPDMAIRHFQEQLKHSTISSSLSRVYYWLARTYSAAGNAGEAQQMYRKASQYGDKFYGQLARQMIGENRLEFEGPMKASARAVNRLSGSFQGQVIKMLGEIERNDLAVYLYLQLIDIMKTKDEMFALAELAEKTGNAHMSLVVGRYGIADGHAFIHYAFPVIGIDHNTAAGTPIPEALVYAITCQESSFNPLSASPAGALGLMQLLPSTAQSVARKIGQDFSKHKLIRDPSFNVTLGGNFLASQISRFDGNLILGIAAYNAGGGRVTQWIERFGRPGNATDQAVDWIETIPFSETREYVMKVLENLQVYRARTGSGYIGQIKLVEDLRASGILDDEISGTSGILVAQTEASSVNLGFLSNERLPRRRPRP